MIDFIVCDDNVKVVNNVKNLIDKFMINNNTLYKTHKFLEFDDNFMKMAESTTNGKIYILDIETPKHSGIDIARKIRAKDKNSVIIFLTAHDELGLVVLKSCLNLLTFICKFDDYETKLFQALCEALNLMSIKRSISFLEHGIKYNILLSSILYITRDTIERKTIIKTDFNEYKIYMPLEKINLLAKNHFKKTHKSCLVNMDRVEKLDCNRNLITFDNGLVIDLLSNKYKKEVVKLD